MRRKTPDPRRHDHTSSGGDVQLTDSSVPGRTPTRRERRFGRACAPFRHWAAPYSPARSLDLNTTGSPMMRCPRFALALTAVLAIAGCSSGMADGPAAGGPAPAPPQTNAYAAYADPRPSARPSWSPTPRPRAASWTSTPPTPTSRTWSTASRRPTRTSRSTYSGRTRRPCCSGCYRRPGGEDGQRHGGHQRLRAAGDGRAGRVCPLRRSVEGEPAPERDVRRLAGRAVQRLRGGWKPPQVPDGRRRRRSPTWRTPSGGVGWRSRSATGTGTRRCTPT